MRRPKSERCRVDRCDARGQTTLVVMVLFVGVLGALGALVDYGDRLADRATAAAIADVVVLAGVAEGRSAALDVARRNDANLVRFVERGPLVQVEVECLGQRATATAELVAER